MEFDYSEIVSCISIFRNLFIVLSSNQILLKLTTNEKDVFFKNNNIIIHFNRSTDVEIISCWNIIYQKECGEKESLSSSGSYRSFTGRGEVWILEGLKRCLFHIYNAFQSTGHIITLPPLWVSTDFWIYFLINVP